MINIVDWEHPITLKQGDKINLTDEQRKKVERNMKIGMLKMLHADGAITNEQLNILIKMQNM